MSYRGRSPIKDVVRSVVMGAGMISPALLEACATNPPTTTAPVTTTPTTTAAMATGEASTPPATSAPPTEVVRPRPSSTGTSMPTRGFAGAARARS